MANENIKILNPGCLAAVERGCTCPLAENNYGHLAPLPNDEWWVDPDCPLHGDSRAIEVVPPLELPGDLSTR